MEITLTDQTAVIFGAGRGIGEAMATVFADAGATVYIADLIEENSKALAEELKAKGHKAVGVKCNVSSYDEIDAVLAQAEEETGRLDIIINNAGIVGLDSFLETSQEDIQKLLNVNLMGANNGMQAGIKRMMKYDHGKIINTASFAGRHAMKEGFAHYGMTKAAVIYLTQAAAYAGADHNINVNAICPGIIRSQMWETILESYEQAGQDKETAWTESLKHFIPLKRGDQKAEDIAYTALFLASPLADHITGQSINVDGGAAMN
ncbi:SDR family oxidoreductase [Aerococcus agrisoli]|uniref:SDR family oxidoreductase n=1 Tax=Aerococcus agrisoli TaxID=2487350 RepID=A0A3N4HFI5_9LACT|nr:SDR family NAD(P)-dependent oxidoreductase [Aerococcus agrisoli]RPA65464.1 SDR family oxidoreductase [Aerococcus agrisoli]